MSARLSRRLALVGGLSLMGAGAGCKTDDAPKGGPAAEASGPSTPSRTIEVACAPLAELDPAQASAIEATARSAYDTLLRQDYDALWGMLHPQAEQGQQREPVIEAFRSMRGRLGPSPEPPRLEWLYHVDVHGGTRDLARVQCGTPRSHDALQLVANAGSENLAVASLWTPGEPYAYATAITLRMRGPTWRLVGLHVAPAAFRGKVARDYLQRANDLLPQRRAVAAYLLLGVARTLSGRGSSVTTAVRDEVDAGLTAIESSQAYRAELGTWSVGEQRFEIHGFGVAATQSDLSAVVQYVSPGGLVRESLEAEADALIDLVRAKYPELRPTFDAVVFEAYREAPTEPEREYDAFRIARYLDPARDPRG